MMRKAFFILGIVALFQSSSFAARVEVTGGGGGSGSVSDTIYGAGWNGDTTVAPSKNAVYDKIETISASGDPILIDTTAVGDAAGVDLTGGTTGIDITFNAAASPDTATFGIDLTELTCGAGLVCASATAIATDSTEAAFLASGALVCGAGTAGKMQVHTTPLQYCDNAATPALQYAAYGNSAGVSTSTASDSAWTSHNSYPAGCAASNWVTTIGDTATCAQPAFTDISGAATDAQVPNTITVDLATTATTANAGDSATAFFSTGTLEVAIGGTGTTTSTGTGAVVLGTSPTFTTGLTIPVGGLTDLSIVEDDLAASLAFDDGDYLNLGGISITTTTEGLTLPGHATDCSLTGTTEGQVCWEADANVLYIGNGATVTAITGGSGAPTTADYLVGTADGGLSAEIVVGTTPGGELGGTWGTPTIDDTLTVTGWVLGASTATTPATKDSDTSLATTAYVQGELASTAGCNNLIVTSAAITTVTITADQCVLLNGTTPKIYQTISETCTITTSGIQGLEASDSEAASTIYEVYLKGKSDGTIDCLLNADATAVTTLPAGYDYSMRVSHVVNKDGGSSNDFYPYVQYGNHLRVIGDAISEFRVLSGGAATVWTNIDMSAFVPSTVRMVELHIEVSGDIFGFETAEANTTYGFLVGRNSYDDTYLVTPTDADQDIEYYRLSGTATGNVDVVGWFENF